MKKFFLLALVVMITLMIFAGCSQPTTEPNLGNIPEEVNPEKPAPAPYFVKNSKWELVDISTLPARMAAPSLDQALEIVAEYNAEHDDDQLFLNTIDVPIEEAPTVDVYYVNEGDYALLAKYAGIDRADFSARYSDFKMDERALGGIMFVDKVPPAPIIPPDLRTREEKYALYMINKYDKIVVYNGYKYEQHIDEIWDTLTDDVKAGYDNDIDKLMASRVAGFEMEIRGVGLVPPDTPWRVVSGQLYVEP